MNKEINILYIAIFLLFVSCQLKSEKEKLLLDQDRCSCSTINSKQYSKYCKFYNKQGKLTSEGAFLKNLANGNHIFYLENSHNKIIREYIVFADTLSYLNQVFKILNDDDTIFEQSNFYQIQCPDTILLGDTLVINIFLEAPAFSSSKIELLAEIPKDTNNIRSIKSNDYRIHYWYLPTKRGNNKFSAMLNEYKERNDTILNEIRILYIYKNYYVK